MAGAGCKSIVRCSMLFSGTSFRNSVPILQGSFFPRLSILAIRFLLADPLRTDLGCIPDTPS